MACAGVHVSLHSALPSTPTCNAKDVACGVPPLAVSLCGEEDLETVALTSAAHLKPDGGLRTVF